MVCVGKGNEICLFRQEDPYTCSALPVFPALQNDRAAMIHNHAVHNGEPQPGPLLARGDIRLQQAVTGRFREAWTIILDNNYTAIMSEVRS